MSEVVSSIRDLGYSVCAEYELSVSDLGMFKTRRTSRYNNEMELTLGSEFDGTTIDLCLRKIERRFPDAGEVVVREERVRGVSREYARRHIRGRVVEGGGGMCLKFAGRVVDIYNILRSEYVYDLAFALTTYYFENLSEESKTTRMTRLEYNRNISRRSARKRDERVVCSLSLDNFRRGQTVATTKCGHRFKSRELRIWLTRECVAPTCPLCRQNLLD